jgi:hypothetical protein
MTNDLKICRCGSGETRYPLNDAAGIFCTYVCSKCEEEKRKEYNPAIFNPDHPYASTGEEDDLERY